MRDNPHNADDPISTVEAVNRHGISAFRAVGENYDADDTHDDD